MNVINPANPPAFHISPEDGFQLHCVYEQTISDGINPPVLIWIGVTKLCDLFNFPDAKRNSEWVKYVTANRKTSTTVVFTGTYNECLNERTRRVVAKHPHCNTRGYDLATAMQIRCINDGKTFPTIAEAAAYYKCAASAISNHINGKPGHRRVKGHQFERVSADMGKLNHVVPGTYATAPAPLQPQPQAPVVPTMTQSPQPMTREEIERKIKEIYAGPPSDEAMEQIRQLNNMLGENQ